MSYSLFISDLHLCDERPGAVERFLEFLSHKALEAKNLYILGDLFDAWVGDDDDSKTAAAVIAGIRRLSDKGTHVFVMHGNRDFLIGEQFCQNSKATLLADPTVIEIAHNRILLTHGDQLCTLDTAYQKSREIRSNSQWLGQLLERSLEERKVIAAEYRKMSGETKSLLADDIMDVTPDEVDRWFAKYNVDMMIHGHTHRPATHQHEINGRQKTRIVLPEWQDHPGNYGHGISIDDQLNTQII